MPREVTTDLAVFERLVNPQGRVIVDIGCGGGGFVRALARLGAHPIGIEISEAQLAAALADDQGSGARYLVGRAQELPLGDGSVDVAVFFKSLHHVAPEDLPAALAESRRVLRSEGVVYVAEPLSEGDYFRLVAMVEDEVEVRAAAQRALARAPAAGLTRQTTVDYEVEVRIDGLAALRTRIVSVDPDRAAVFDARRAEIGQALAELGTPTGRGQERSFLQPMRADVLAG